MEDNSFSHITLSSCVNVGASDSLTRADVIILFFKIVFFMSVQKIPTPDDVRRKSASCLGY